MGKGSRRERWRERGADRRPAPPEPAPEPPPEAAPPTPAPTAKAPPAPRPQAGRRAACYVDFENLFYGALQHAHTVSVPRVVRHLNRLCRSASGEGFAHTAVYANWDGISLHARHAQDDWAMLGWRTIHVPTREDYAAARTVKNLVDFVMTLDMVEDARDREWDHFYIVSGDQDFCEAAERLKRRGRRVTVVALQPSLGWRLREAADETYAWGLEDVAGDEPLPLQSYKRLVEVTAPARPAAAEDPYEVLRRAVRMAERDLGVAPVAWRVVRDEYFLRMVSMRDAEADRFARELADAGFLNLVTRRARDGSSQAFVSVPGP